MKKPHKHSELIKQWADGAKIQYWTGVDWFDCINNEPSWNDENKFRIKPEKKPDVETYRRVILLNDGAGILYATMDNNAFTGQNPNVKFTFDGETGELKSAEVLR